jgi:hypothetical protein
MANIAARRVMEMRRHSGGRINMDYRRGYDRGEDYRGYDRRGYDRRSSDYARGNDYNDGRDYARGRRDYADGNDYADYDDGYDRHSQPFNIRGEMDYEMDGNDYADEMPMKLSKRDMQEWKHRLRNSDGTAGEHFDMEQIVRMGENIGVRFRDYSEKEFAMAANMLYSDLAEAVKGIIPPDKETMVFAKMAKAWLEDEDGPDPREKLALYYHCIVKG